MNRWYLGAILGFPVELFVSDDYSIEYYLDEDSGDPPGAVIHACEQIERRSKALRSWAGLNRMLAEEGWSNG